MEYPYKYHDNTGYEPISYNQNENYAQNFPDQQFANEEQSSHYQNFGNPTYQNTPDY